MTQQINESQVANLVSDLAARSTIAGIQKESYIYAADTGSANVYAIALSPAPSLVAGSFVSFKAANANTGASTLNVNGGGAVAIKKNGNSTALASGDIAAGQIIDATYDGTVWQILVPGSGGGSGTVTSVGLSMPSDFSVSGSPITGSGTIAITGGVTKSAIQQQSYVYAADTGSANAYVVALSPAPTIVAGSYIAFKATSANTGASTLAVNGGGATAIKKQGSTALASGDIASGQIVEVIYDGTNYQLIASSSTGGSGVSSLNSLTGALSIAAGTNVTVTPSGSNITIAATGGGGASFPLNIPGCFIWCAADQLTGFSNNDPMPSWENLAGGPALSMLGTNNPKYITGAVNSLPVIRFDGTAWYIITSPDLIQGREWSMFFALKISSLANSYTGMFKAASGSMGYYIKSTGKTAFYTASANYDGSGSATALTTSNYYVVSIIFGPKGVVTRVALAADFSSTSTSYQGGEFAGHTAFALGNDSDNAGRIFTGDIAEIIAVRRAVTSAELSTIENALKTKYGL